MASLKEQLKDKIDWKQVDLVIVRFCFFSFFVITDQNGKS
jgi:hypothetical protein